MNDFIFDRSSLPANVQPYMKVIQVGKTIHCTSILFIELSNRVKDLMAINYSTTEPPLTGSYSKISLERLRFWIHVHSLQQFGFSEKNADKVKGMFVGINL